MRSTKYRGKSPQDNRFHFGDDLIIGVPYNSNSYYIADDKASILWEIDRETIGQFVGLKDCNGAEIYEGDIIQIPEVPSLRLSVEYDKYLAEFILVEHTYTEGIIKGTTSIGNMQRHYPQLRVIGNVHDNPELLGKTK